MEFHHLSMNKTLRHEPAGVYCSACDEVALEIIEGLAEVNADDTSDPTILETLVDEYHYQDMNTWFWKRYPND